MNQAHPQTTGYARGKRIVDSGNDAMRAALDGPILGIVNDVVNFWIANRGTEQPCGDECGNRELYRLASGAMVCPRTGQPCTKRD